jgi:hypothetical protein
MRPHMAACQARSQLTLNLDTYNPSYFYEVMRFIFMQKISMLTLNVRLKMKMVIAGSNGVIYKGKLHN